MTFSYDGSNFYGYQKQPNKRTVQQEIEDVLSKINNKKITISSSGRTDSKVHATNQKAHFDLEKKWDLDKLKITLNKMLPDDIYIKNIKKVKDSFHARYNVKKKIYLYKINMGEYNPIDRNYIYQYNKELDINKMKKASSYLIGEHNFRSFTKTNPNEISYIREIYDIKFRVKNNILMIEFIGNGFMRYMVRNLVGTLIEVGENKINPKEIKTILESKNRENAYKTISPVGLYLKDVKY